MKQVLASLGLVAALGTTACAPLDGFFGRTFAGMGSMGGSWSGPLDTVPTDSVTVQRVRVGGGAGGAEQVLPEEGNVWPAEEGPRATLANPDEALRGIPSYRPGNETDPPLRAAVPATRSSTRAGSTAFEPPPGWQPPGSSLSTGGTSRTITGGSGGVGTTIGPSGQSGVLLGRPGDVQILQEPGRPAQQILPRP